MCARRTGEEGLEEVVDRAERAKITAETRCTSTVPHPGMAIAIISSTLLGIAQDLIGLIDLDKASFGSLLFIRIRVVLLRETTEGLFDLVLARGPRYPQYLVIISFACSHLLIPCSSNPSNPVAGLFPLSLETECSLLISILFPDLSSVMFLFFYSLLCYLFPYPGFFHSARSQVYTQ